MNDQSTEYENLKILLDQLDITHTASEERARKAEEQVVKLEQKITALESSLEISRTQTKDAFERVAIEHNEKVALETRVAEVTALVKGYIQGWRARHEL